jgi:hypothetical protein
MEFREFPKIPRLRREVVVTEKIDGTNACVVIPEDGSGVFAQSRNRIITPEADNFGFAAWVRDNAEALKALGFGYHYGEWYGRGIGRNYGLTDRRFALFNAGRWTAETVPSIVSVVPVLAKGVGLDAQTDAAMARLRSEGSVAVPGFMNPEGVIVYHVASRSLYKVTCEKDDEWKGKSA